MGSYYTLHHHPTRVEPLRAKKVFSVRENVYIFMKEQVYSARAQDGPRILKETKQHPGTDGPDNMLGCCLVYFHFLWAILSMSTVHGG